MHLLQSWKNSLQILQPNNLSQFCLLAGNTLVRIMRILTGPCWWLGLLLLASTALLFFGSSSWPVNLTVQCMSAFFILLLSRASIQAKDTYYIMQYTKNYFVSSLLLLVAVVICTTLLFVVPASLLKSWMIEIFSIDNITSFVAQLFIMSNSCIPSIISVWFQLSILSLFDRGLPSLHSARFGLEPQIKSARMIWYALPIFLIYMIFTQAFNMLEFFILFKLIARRILLNRSLITVYYCLSFLFRLLCSAAVLSTLYTKLLYENPCLYIDSK